MSSPAVDVAGSSLGKCQCLGFVVNAITAGSLSRVCSQLIQPKLQNTQKKAPAVTNHALNPPSGY